MSDGSDLEVVGWEEEDMSREEVPEMLSSHHACARFSILSPDRGTCDRSYPVHRLGLDRC